jgi:anti-sigma factor RsiW
MRIDPFSEDMLVRYLLGDLTEDEQVAIEERAFQDPPYRRRIEAAEGDLIDAYVRGELSEPERRQFEGRFFASAERRRKVEFARTLARVAPEFAVIEQPARPANVKALVSRPGLFKALLAGLNPVAQFALIAAALLVMIGGAWLIVESVRLRAQVTALRAEQQSRERDEQALKQQLADDGTRREELATELQRERDERERSQQLAGELQRKLDESTARPAPSAIVSLALWPGLSRTSGARAKLALPQSAQSVRVEVGVEPEDEYRSFGVELRGPTGPVWSQRNLPARRVRAGRAVILNLPARLLRPGNYELLLKGVTREGATEDVAYHYFEVLKK